MWCDQRLAAVDYLAVFDQATPLELIQALKPDVLVKGADYRADEVVGGEFWTGEIARHDRLRLAYAVWTVLSRRLLGDA